MGNQKDKANFSNTDDRKKGVWKTRYPNKCARQRQFFEAAYLFVLFLISLSIIFLCYLDVLSECLHIPEAKILTFNKMATCMASGLLGGTINNIKWFYHSVARGFWNEDRKYWRFFTPYVSLVLAFIISCILSDTTIINGSGFSAVTVGFLAGYFSDQAAGKMAEVAAVLFNTKTETKPNEEDNSSSQE